jgi:ubiquinone/menaquinone biosynthesis C-methylase UbiE
MKKYQVKDIKSGWQDSTVADSYDDKRFSSISGRLSDCLDKFALRRSLSSLPKTANILDMPCGTGRISHYLVTHGYENITCADISSDMTNVASSLLKPFQNIEFYNTDAENTPFDDASYDVILAIRFMGHLPRDTRVNVLKEMGRICKGSIIIEYPITNPFARHIKKLFKSLTVKNVLPTKWIWHYLSMAEAKQEVSDAGLITQKVVRKLSYISESAYFSITHK